MNVQSMTKYKFLVGTTLNSSQLLQWVYGLICSVDSLFNKDVLTGVISALKLHETYNSSFLDCLCTSLCCNLVHVFIYPFLPVHEEFVLRAIDTLSVEKISLHEGFSLNSHLQSSCLKNYHPHAWKRVKKLSKLIFSVSHTYSLN